MVAFFSARGQLVEVRVRQWRSGAHSQAVKGFPCTWDPPRLQAAEDW